MRLNYNSNMQSLKILGYYSTIYKALITFKALIIFNKFEICAKFIKPKNLN